MSEFVYTVWKNDFPVMFSDSLENCLKYVQRQKDFDLTIVRNSDDFKFDRILEDFIE